MRAVSLFSGAGIGESRLKEIGINVVVANEFLSDRAALFRKINSDTQMIEGDIREASTKDSIISSAGGIDLLIATPPCQGVSVAGSNRNLELRLRDPRNYLLFDVVQMIQMLEPKHVIIENVPQFAKLLLPVDGNLTPVPLVLSQLLGSRYNVGFQEINSADVGVPQVRRRVFFHLTSKKPFEGHHFSASQSSHVTLQDVIGDLPSLEAGEKSDIPWHFARRHSANHIRWMQNTPTGHSAFENLPEYRPTKPDGSLIKAFNTTYRRMNWDKPAPAITMRNDAISSQANVHPGRKKANGTYSDARVLTPRELLMLNSMDMGSFENLETEENLLRRVLGEGVPPLMMNAVVKKALA